MSEAIVLAFKPMTPTQLRTAAPTLYNIYNDLFWATTFMLIALFSISLYYVIHHSKQKFAIRLLSLCLLSNVTAVIWTVIFNWIHKFINNNTGEVLGWRWILVFVAFLCFITSSAFFNIATWLLAFNYYVCSEKLDQVHTSRSTKTAPSDKRTLGQQIIFWTMLVLCTASSTIWAYFRFMRNYSGYKGGNLLYARQEFYA
jgi:MFS family permease